jgi:hypothetical protein
MRETRTALRARLTYANAMATIAVFLALGGGTFAFAALKKNSVGTKQIAKNAVKEAELARNAVTTKKIAAGAVTDAKLGAISIAGNEIADNAVTTPKLADGAVTGLKVDESSLGEVPLAARAGEAGNVLFVSVNGDGNIAAQGQPGTTVSKVPLVLGRYTANFGRNLAGCSAAATVGFNGEAPAIPNDAVAGASIETLGQNSSVTVQTRDLAGAEEDNNFHLVVVC